MTYVGSEEGLVVVLQADDVVRDEGDRIDAGLGRRAVELERHVVLAAARRLLGHLDGLGRPLRAELDELAADLDLGDAELADLRGVGVADRALAGADRGDDAAGALGALAADRVGPRLRRLLGPHVGGRRRGGSR